MTRCFRAAFKLRAGSRKGSSYIEFALVLLPLLALALGIIDFAVPIFLWSTFNHAAREGVRYGITYQTKSGLSHSESIKSVVQANAAGFLAGSVGMSKIQVKFYSPTTFLEVTGANANDGGNIVEVSVVGYEWGWTVPLWRSRTPLSINVASADRLEVLPRNIMKPAAW
jgi:Flp pilus assembly protein TadG